MVQGKQDINLSRNSEQQSERGEDSSSVAVDVIYRSNMLRINPEPPIIFIWGFMCSHNMVMSLLYVTIFRIREATNNYFHFRLII